MFSTKNKFLKILNLKSEMKIFKVFYKTTNEIYFVGRQQTN